MATSAPFGTDEQGAWDCKIIGGKQVYLDPHRAHRPGGAGGAQDYRKHATDLTNLNYNKNSLSEHDYGVSLEKPATPQQSQGQGQPREGGGGPHSNYNGDMRDSSLPATLSNMAEEMVQAGRFAKETSSSMSSSVRKGGGGEAGGGSSSSSHRENRANTGGSGAASVRSLATNYSSSYSHAADCNKAQKNPPGGPSLAPSSHEQQRQQQERQSSSHHTEHIHPSKTGGDNGGAYNHLSHLPNTQQRYEQSHNRQHDYNDGVASASNGGRGAGGDGGTFVDRLEHSRRMYHQQSAAQTQANNNNGPVYGKKKTDVTLFENDRRARHVADSFVGYSSEPRDYSNDGRNYMLGSNNMNTILSETRAGNPNKKTSEHYSSESTSGRGRVKGVAERANEYHEHRKVDDVLLRQQRLNEYVQEQKRGLPTGHYEGQQNTQQQNDRHLYQQQQQHQRQQPQEQQINRPQESSHGPKAAFVYGSAQYDRNRNTTYNYQPGGQNSNDNYPNEHMRASEIDDIVSAHKEYQRQANEGPPMQHQKDSFGIEWQDRFLSLVNGLKKVDYDQIGYLDKPMARKVSCNYNLVYSLGIPESKIDFALLQNETKNGEVHIEDFAMTLFKSAMTH
eukprot:Nk52_evm35s2152 gene=Nk52_evmTU35s2152